MKEPPKFKLSCTDWNARHVKFYLFDPSGANCGQIVILTDDVKVFLQNSWKGIVFWNDKMPKSWADSQ